jgi:hypothetical protein
MIWPAGPSPPGAKWRAGSTGPRAGGLCEELVYEGGRHAALVPTAAATHLTGPDRRSAPGDDGGHIDRVVLAALVTHAVRRNGPGRQQPHSVAVRKDRRPQWCLPEHASTPVTNENAAHDRQHRQHRPRSPHQAQRGRQQQHLNVPTMSRGHRQMRAPATRTVDRTVIGTRNWPTPGFP